MSLEHLNTKFEDLSNEDLVSLATETESRIETLAASLIALARQAESGEEVKHFEANIERLAEMILEASGKLHGIAEEMGSRLDKAQQAGESPEG